MHNKKGFTLIELLVVIAILVILSVAVVLALNPAQMLMESRDAQRLSDFSSIRTAVNLFLTTATSTTVGTSPLETVSGATCAFTAGACTFNATTSIDGTGWVGINLGGATGGSPLSFLPLDPRQTTTYFYSYVGDDVNKTFEINGRLESNKYRDLMTKDGGNKNTCGTDYGTGATAATCFFEVGNAPGLAL